MTTFFQHQEKARKRTALLIFLFALAVFGIGCAIYALYALLMHYGGDWKGERLFGIPWDTKVFLWTTGITLGFIGLVSLSRTLSLRSGGGPVAQMLGGRLVRRDTTDALEKRLLNVVEEMAIASGVPVPEVYVLDREVGINAFAAGYNVENAAIAVTRGALERLNRDELQGVIAHEFSHILNGDMRLNIRLIGVLFGILAIALVGRVIVYFASRSSSRKNKGVPALVLLGLALILIGYIGVFIGRLIQAAVSRQREFLADASAVQFTRNPYGIGGALLKILRLEEGSVLASPRAAEAAHLFFGEGVRNLFGLFSTHPPLKERIRRIEPRLLEQGLEAASRDAEPSRPTVARRLRQRRVTPAQMLENVGAVSPVAAAFAAGLVGSLPQRVQESLRTPERAALLLCALLVAPDEATRTQQVRILHESGFDAGDVLRMAQEIPKQRAAALALVELCIPALRAWPKENQQAFAQLVKSLILADQKVTLFEFGLFWLLKRRLEQDKGPDRVSYKNVRQVVREACEVLAGLALAGNRGDRDAALDAFKQGIACLGLSEAEREKMVSEFQSGALGHLEAIGAALDTLRASSLAVRREVLEALGRCALSDEKVTAEEAEMLRFVGIALGLPLPPWVEEVV